MTVIEAYRLEATDPDCIADAEALELLREVPWRRMIVLGDSVASGVREPVDGYRDECWADRVGEALLGAHPEAAYRNLAIRDAQLADIRSRQLSGALAFGPDIAIVVGGGNDAIRRSYTPDRVRDGLRSITVPLAESGAFVVTIGLFDLARSGLVPPEHAPAMIERFDELDEITASVAMEVGGLHVDSHHHPRASDPGIFASDLMHANTRGHAIAFAATVRALSARASASGGAVA